MENWIGKNALVTGANSGIGATVTKRFLENGINVYALDKDIDNLYEMKTSEIGENLNILQANVLKKEEVERSVKWLEENVNEINIFVHSVGIFTFNSLTDGDYTQMQNMLNTNVIGLCVMVKAIANLMLRQNVQNGQIITISSSFVFETTYAQEFHYYCAIQSAISALTRGLETELKERKSTIKVTTLYPGLVRTGILRNSSSIPYDEYIFKTFVALTPDDIVDSISYILSIDRNVTVNRIVLTPRGLITGNAFMQQ